MQTFLKINDVRLLKSSIKKYIPFNENKLNIYFSTSRYKVSVESFSFKDVKERDDVINYLDEIYIR